MIIRKITPGFVIQKFDTETKEYVSQEFTAENPVDYETEDRGEVGEADLEDIAARHNFGPYAESEPYLPFDMLQPKDMVNLREN
jgi:hypothetical protein